MPHQPPLLLQCQHLLPDGVLNRDPVYQIGKGEIDDTLKQGIADCIAARELIKVKVLENSEYSAREAADILCEAIGCECVQVIGRKFVLFKQKKKESAYTAVLAK